MPELPDVELYLHALRPRLLAQPLEAVRIASPFLIRSVEHAAGRCGRPIGRHAPPLGKRIVWQFGPRSLLRHPPDDRRTLPVEGVRCESSRAARAGGIRFPSRHVAPDRSGLLPSRIAARRREPRTPSPPSIPEGWTCSRSIGRRSRRACARRITHSSVRSPIRGCSAASATRIRTRSCMPRGYRRSSSRAGSRRRRRQAVRRGAVGARPLAQRLICRSRRSISCEGHRVPRGDGGTRPLRQAVPGVRHADPAHPLRGQRGQLLSDLPDRRPAPGRSRRCRACSARTGRGRSKSSSGAKPAINGSALRGKPVAFRLCHWVTFRAMYVARAISGAFA